MSNIDKFIAYLIVGLLIIAGMLVVFNVRMFQPSRYAVTSIGDTGIDVLNTTGEFIVGKTPEEIPSIYHFLDARASYKEETSEYKLPDRRLVNGLLFGSNEMRIDIKNLGKVQEAYLSFEVKDTNNYSPLLILVNNELAASAPFNIGKQKLVIPEENLNKLKGDATITIKPASSGWFLWAPALYDLKNPVLVIKQYVKRKPVIEFDLSKEKRAGFERGWINLTEKPGITRNVAGNISVYLNTALLYSGPSHSLKIDYKPEYLKPSNTIQIIPEKNSKFIGDVIFTLYYITDRDNRVFGSFNLSESQYDNLEQATGAIKFRINRILHQGGVSVKLNGRTICPKYGSCYPDAKEGVSYSFLFNQAEAKLGNNTFAVSPVDQSTFGITDLQVLVE